MNIIEFNNVGTLELFVDLNFRIEGIFVVLVLKNFVFVDNFDSDLSLCFFLDPQIDLWEGPFSKFSSQKDEVLPYSFLCVAHQLNKI